MSDPAETLDLFTLVLADTIPLNYWGYAVAKSLGSLEF